MIVNMVQGRLGGYGLSFNQVDLEDIPVSDIDEGAPLVQWNDLEGDDELDRVVAFGEVESVQDGGQPWVEIVG